MRRRTLLGGMTSAASLTLAASAGLLSGCTQGGGLLRPPGLFTTPSGEPLRRVRVADDRVIRTVVGLRPYRPVGFRVEAEKLDATTVIHNYGHGGGGWTLSWGSAHLAMELAEQTGARSAAVLGCGILGLSTARLLQRQGWDVTIYARDLPPDTTSNIAGAQWSPASVFDHEAVDPRFRARFERALRLSYRYFQDLVGDRYGVRWVSNYMLRDAPRDPDEPDFRRDFPDLYPESRTLAVGEHPFPMPHVEHFDTMFMEPPVYLPAILQDFRMAGGRIVVREFEDLRQIAALAEPVVVNCTGLGARALFDDPHLVPVKGQLTVLKPQSELHYLVIYRGLYMFPRRDGVLLGGTHEEGNWDLAVNEEAKARIMAGHKAFFEAMRDPLYHD